MSGLKEARDILQRTFGFPDFRPGQQEVIERILKGQPTLAVMPTGAGKSLCYQLPALTLPGLAVVVSPLIALMHNQVRSLQGRGLKAAAWTSSTSSSEREELVYKLQSDQLDLLYVAPERFRSQSAMRLIQSAQPSLFVVDEVHCVSQWGHDFRPDYARLGEVLARLRENNSVRFAGLTATATAKVREDIAKSLGVEDDLEVVVTGFDRPNLKLGVSHVSQMPQSQERRLDVIAENLSVWMGDSGSAIIYAPTRKRAEETTEGLRSRGFDASCYHAGLDAKERESAQEKFETQSQQVMVATNAFGMGIDKPDIRLVAHLSLPDSPEAYYQEMGRAGRDGQPAGVLLLWDPAELRYALHRVEAASPTPELVHDVREDLAKHLPDSGPMSLDELVRALEPQFGPATRAALVALEQAGDLVWVSGSAQLEPGPSQINQQLLHNRAAHLRGRLSAAIGYVQRAKCRRQYLVQYFEGPSKTPPCGICDRCTEPSPSKAEGDLYVSSLKTLSCIARVKGKYGKSRVVDVLLGAKNKNVLGAGLEKLSTYGLMSHWKRTHLLELIDSLIRADLAELTLEDFPKVRLTHSGAQTLREKRDIFINFQPKAARSNQPKADVELPHEDQTLFNKLREWRTNEAKTQSVPSFIVASDAVLRALATTRPSSLDALAQVKGIGHTKLERYGTDLLNVISFFSDNTANGS